MKRVPITAKPTGSEERRSADAWVEQQKSVAASEPSKRLTIDIPQSLHLQVKSQCVMRGINMVDVVREFLEREFRSENPKDTGNNGSAVPARKPKLR